MITDVWTRRLLPIEMTWPLSFTCFVKTHPSSLPARVPAKRRQLLTTAAHPFEEEAQGVKDVRSYRIRLSSSVNCWGCAAHESIRARKLANREGELLLPSCW